MTRKDFIKQIEKMERDIIMPKEEALIESVLMNILLLFRILLDEVYKDE